MVGAVHEGDEGGETVEDVSDGQLFERGDVCRGAVLCVP
ncbi:hypothetical protein M877_22005 [Streptomyces niveus NCIMB 11891]|nr:hypothetical protein M877_22005 [Streptomyces niveus NCIMB 11891]